MEGEVTSPITKQFEKEPLCKTTTIYKLTINPDHMKNKGVFFKFIIHFSFQPTIAAVIDAIREYKDMADYLDWTRAEAIYALGKVGLPTFVGNHGGCQVCCYSPGGTATISIHLEKIQMITG